MPNEDVSSLHATWFHSHEESEPDRIVYRPDSFDLPPSRGRDGFELKPDGSAVSRQPGADDRATAESGQWRQSGERLEIERAGRRDVFEIVHLDPSMLVLRPAGD